jgi:hypothetical protein
MHTRVGVILILSLIGMAAAGVAVARPNAALQRVAITSPKGNTDKFALLPLTTGRLARDSGTAFACCWSRKFLQRDGQAVEIDNPLRTFTTKKGSFTWRASIEWVDPGNGYYVGTGTWKIVRGTGAYAGVVGHGRVVVIQGTGDQDLTTRAEGLLGFRG